MTFKFLIFYLTEILKLALKHTQETSKIPRVWNYNNVHVKFRVSSALYIAYVIHDDYLHMQRVQYIEHWLPWSN